MVIGKTSSSISKTEIFSRFSETQVLCTVFPQIQEIPCKICSPLREDHDPSLGIYMDDNNHIRFKDFGDSSMQGGLIDLLCAYWKCSFRQALDRICHLMVKDDAVAVKPKQIRTFTRRESNHLSQLQVAIRPWHDYDYAYWASYGISRQWLKYAEIYPISYKIITKKDADSGRTLRYTFPADRYAYVFVERKEGQLQLKIYQPYNTRGFKWCSKMDASVIGLWTKIPQQGDRVVICSSLKDALVISCQLHIPALCLQGEGYSMSDTAVSELKRRYKKVFISFDTDEAGLQDGRKLAERTGFVNVIPDLGKEKDFSDYWKSLEDKNQFKQLKTLFN